VVSVAIQTGRLHASVGMKNNRPHITDIDLADKEWAANTRSGARTLRALETAGNVPILAVSNAKRAAALAALAELELAERKRDLIPAADVAAKFVEVVTSAKNKLLGVPARVKQRLPHISADDVRVIDDLVREALEDLASDGTERR
jgi:phage terminase Nu1 subunit (DNA packaging protein)